MRQRRYAADYPLQTIYTISATARIIGIHVTTAHRWIKEGKLRVVETPVGRRITRDEIARQSGQAA